MQAKELCKRVAEFVQPLADENGVYIWDVEFEKEGGEYMLTVFIDNDEGISIETCEAISRKVDPYLDGKEFSALPPYTLCVSSAGLGRKLTKEMHFEKFIGHNVEIKFFKPMDGIKETEGKLLSYTNGEVSAETMTGVITFNIKDAAFVRLAVEF